MQTGGYNLPQSLSDAHSVNPDSLFPITGSNSFESSFFQKPCFTVVFQEKKQDTQKKEYEFMAISRGDQNQA